MALLAIQTWACLRTMTDNDEISKSRRRLVTPTSLLLMLVVGEILLVLSDRFDWLAINERKGWTVLLCVTLASFVVLVLAAYSIVRLVARRSMQFNLSTLLILVVALAIPCGWLTAEVRAADRQRETIAAIRAEGFSCFYDYSVTTPGQVQKFSGSRSLPFLYERLGEDFFHNIVAAQPRADAHLRLLRRQTEIHTLLADHSQITDAGLESVAGLQDMRWLDLSDSPRVSSAGIKHLRDLTQLEFVNLRRTQVSDEGLAHLQNKKRLRRLDLGMTRVTGTGLRHVTASTQLRELHFWGNAVEDDSLAALRGMTRLRKLDLGGALVTDAGLKYLSRCKELEMLGLRGARVSDAGLRELASHTELRELDLFNTQVSDAGLKQLVGFRNLELVYVGETKVTTNGLAKLQKALPNCRIR